MRVTRLQSLLLGAALCAAACGHTAPATNVPRFAYVFGADGAVSGYAVNPRTGQLRPNGYALSPNPVDGVDAATSVAPALAVSDAGFVYMVAQSSSAMPALTTYAVEPSTGILRPLPTIARPGPSPMAVVAHPSGKVMYVVDVSATHIQAAAVDAATGTLTDVGHPAVPPGIAMLSRVTVDPRGRFLLVAERDGEFPRFSDWIASTNIDAATGELDTAWSKAQLAFEVGALAVHPGSRCGVAAPRNHDPRLAAFSISQGADVTAGPLTATALGVQDLAIDPSGRTLLVLDSAGVLAFEITDAEKCALGPAHGPMALPFAPATSLSFEPSGRFAYVTSPGSDHVTTLAIDGPGSVRAVGSVRTRARTSAFPPVFTRGERGVSFAPHFLYAANAGSDDISVFGVDWKTGALTLKGSQSALGSAPSAMAVDPWGRFAFVANAGSSTVASFVINKMTGALARVSVPSPAGTRPVALAADPSGRLLYVASQGSSQIAVFSVDQTSGELAAVFGSPFKVDPPPASVAVDSTGLTLYATSAGPRAALSAFPINEVVGAIGAPLSGLAFDGSGAGTGTVGVDVAGELVFLAEDLADALSLFRPARAGAAIERMARAAAGSRPTSLAIDPLGRFVYAAPVGGASISSFTFSRDPAALALAGTFGAGVPLTLRGLAADPSGHFVYAADEGRGGRGNVHAFTVDGSTGALTPIGSAPAGIRTAAIAVARYHE